MGSPQLQRTPFRYASNAAWSRAVTSAALSAEVSLQGCFPTLIPGWKLKRSSERYVVLCHALPKIIVRLCGLLCRRGTRTARHGDRPRRVFAAFRWSFAAPSLAASQQDHITRVDHYVGRVHFLAVLIFITARLQTAFQIHARSLQQVRCKIFRLPQRDVAPVRLFLPLSGLRVLPVETGGNRELCDRSSARGELGFGVPSEVSEQDNFD